MEDGGLADFAASGHSLVVDSRQSRDASRDTEDVPGAWVRGDFASGGDPGTLRLALFKTICLPARRLPAAEVNAPRCWIYDVFWLTRGPEREAARVAERKTSRLLQACWGR